MSLQQNNLPAGFCEDEDIRVELYSQYGQHVFESLEQFCDRMAITHGEDWVIKFTRKTKDR